MVDSNNSTTNQKMNRGDLRDVGLDPNIVGLFDIVHDKGYDWTVSNQDLARSEVPWIRLTEYQQTQAGIINSNNYMFEQGRSIIDSQNAAEALQKLKNNPYKGLYNAQPTGNVYVLPFYSDYNHTIQNNWGENRGPLGPIVEGIAVPLAKTFLPAGGVETSKGWEGMSVVSYPVKFQLLNTIDPENNIPNHIAFKDMLISANLQYRLLAVASIPPVLYEIEIPGVRYAPVAVINQLTVTNVGQLNLYENDQIIPDAWEFTLNITELIAETRQLYELGQTGGKIEAFVYDSAAKDVFDQAKEIGNKLVEKYKNNNQKIARGD